MKPEEKNPNTEGQNPEDQKTNETPKQESFAKRWFRRTWRYAVAVAIGAAGGVAFYATVNARKADAGNETETEEETDETENSEEEIIPEF